MAYLAGHQEPRVLCDVYAKLIGLLMFHALTTPLRWDVGPGGGRELSRPKALQTLRRYVRDLASAWRLPAAQVLAALEEVLQRVEARWQRYALKDRRRTRVSTCRAIDQAAQAPQPAHPNAAPPPEALYA